MDLIRNQEQDIVQILEAFKYREKLLKTVNKAAEILLTASEEGVKEALLAAMEIVGHCLEADRVQIWRNEIVDGELCFVIRHSWLSELGKQKIEVPVGLKFLYSEFPEWLEKFSRGESINAPISKLSAGEAALLGPYEVLSVVCLPLFLNQELIGFFSVDDCQRERSFTDDEMNMFASTGLMFTSVFIRIMQAANINERNNLLQAVNQAAGFLLNSSIESFDNSLFQAMGVIAKAVKVDRMFVFKNHIFEGKLCCTQIHEWSEGIEPQQGNELVVNATYSEVMSSEWFDKISGGSCINSIVRNLPAEMQQRLVPQGIVSILLVPIFVKDEFWGFIGFDDCHNERVFSEEEESILCSCGLLFVNAMLRNVMVKNIRDTTAKLEDALEQATAASRAKGNFLSNMSHEMRTPMNAIIGMTAIGKKTDDLEEKNRALTKINDAASHLLGLISDVLDMAKIEAGKMEIVPVEYHFEKMLQRVLTLNRYHLDAKQQTLTLNIEKNIPVFVVGDEQRLTQVITNVLSNAIKFTGENGEIHIDASLAGENGKYLELQISVSDNGVGIPAERLGKVFNAFEQVENKFRPVHSGTGLGLPITKHIVEMMGGKISVDSVLRKGTKITLTVLVKPGLKTEADEYMEVAANGEIDMADIGEFQGKKLLLVEDIEINREIMVTFLEQSGLIIDCAGNGKEALEMVTADLEKYDIIFMDIQMPEMSGLEATEQIRALHRQKELPIIALTANVFRDDIDKCLAAGMNDHLCKPFDMDKVFNVLRQYLSQ